ncbi:MAG: ATP-binding protein [Bacteroidales bacterium]|nr:ATP-binding protein [Bacteroidales bacterium]MCK9499037.1 ATP-binding protein [Bacteroidales bacterium]MDY0313960.1 ATP-binding protein [Bacteroidales bacterium]
MKTLDLHIIDIVHNSIRAKANEILIEIKDLKKDNFVDLLIQDNGSGISPEKLVEIQESFYSSRKERKIGMGLALLKYHAEICDGKFEITSELGKGTKVFASFVRNHIDRQPLGDIAGTIATFICQYSDINFIFRYHIDNDMFEISTEDIKSVFEDVDLNNFTIISSIKELIFNSIN